MAFCFTFDLEAAFFCATLCIPDMGYLVTIYSLDTDTFVTSSEGCIEPLSGTGYILQDVQYRCTADPVTKTQP